MKESRLNLDKKILFTMEDIKNIKFTDDKKKKELAKKYAKLFDLTGERIEKALKDVESLKKEAEEKNIDSFVKFEISYRIQEKIHSDLNYQAKEEDNISINFKEFYIEDNFTIEKIQVPFREKIYEKKNYSYRILDKDKFNKFFYSIIDYNNRKNQNTLNYLEYKKDRIKVNTTFNKDYEIYDFLNDLIRLTGKESQRSLTLEHGIIKIIIGSQEYQDTNIKINWLKNGKIEIIFDNEEVTK